MVCHEIQAFHDLLIPRYRIEVDDEGGEPEAHSDPDDLEEAHVSTRVNVKEQFLPKRLGTRTGK